ncbi:hypothetical protein PM082_002064 [Marasmius tenuissimus]|nr:hypothetical protein PM082_002064 [Marasmius tenuissimus]
MTVATFFTNAQDFTIHGGDFNPVNGDQHRTANSHTNCSTMGSYNTTNTVRRNCGNRSTRNTYRVHQQTASGSMIGPSSGVYYVKNIRTGYFLTTEEIGSGEKIWTDSAKVATPACFHIAESGGMYQIVERTKGLSIGARVSGSNRELIWQRSVYTWTFQQVSPGVWNIGTPADDTYWFDEWKQGRWVILSKGSASDENNWRLISASI